MQNSTLFLLLLTFICLSLASCASNNKKASDAYLNSAKNHESEALLWESMGNRGMTEYHQQEAQKAYHNVTASCDDFDIVLYELILSSEKCNKKH